MGLGACGVPNTPAREDYDRLGALLPAGRVLLGEEALARYATDQSTRAFGAPWAVVLAECEEDVSACLAWADAGGFPVITRGAGTGVSGGAVAVGGGVILSVERMRRIVEIDRENFTATCEPGVITADLQSEAAKAGLFYPPDPASLDSCTIGGNVAVGAGGPRAVKYGTTRDYVLGMRVVLPGGGVVELGGKNVKDATGYRLLDLMVGSEGTLGVVTSVTLRLLPKPGFTASMLAPFPSIDRAARAVSALLAANLSPTLAEFMDEVAIEAAAKLLGRELPSAGIAGAYVFLGFDGEEKAGIERRMVAADALCRAEGAFEVYAAQDGGQEARLWESRKVLGDAMKALSPEIGKADVVVPRARVPELVTSVKETAKRLGVRIACFGHAGDGNVHVNILREGMDGARWAEILPLAMGGVMAEVKRLGGRPSGEHGIGSLKRAELMDFAGERAVEIMRGIRAVFDPRGIMNPGKVT